MKHSSLLPAVLTDVARKLGGDEVPGLPTNYKRKDMFSGHPSWITLRYVVPRSIRTKLSVRSGPGTPEYLYYWDNLYREGLEKEAYYIETPGSVVRISRSRSIEEYFHRRINGLVLVVELSYTDRESVSERCFVPSMVNRLIPVKEAKQQPIWYSHTVKYLVGEGDSDDLSILLLLEETTFNVEFRLSPERAKKLDRVIAWFDDQSNSPSNVCNAVIRND